MELSGKKVAILAEEMFNEHELFYPYYRLKEAGAEVIVVGSGSAMTYRGKSGLSVNVDKNADQVSADELAGLVIPGGYAPDRMRLSAAMVGLVRDVFNQGKPVAAICHAGWMLASAEIVAGKRLTSYVAIKDDLVHAGANWVDEELVVDGNLITSRTPDDLPVFGRAIVAALKKG